MLRQGSNLGSEAMILSIEFPIISCIIATVPREGGRGGEGRKGGGREGGIHDGVRGRGRNAVPHTRYMYM